VKPKLNLSTDLTIVSGAADANIKIWQAPTETKNQKVKAKNLQFFESKFLKLVEMIRVQLLEFFTFF
jgi:hypothetical protein